MSYIYEVFSNSRHWHPLKGPCQEKTPPHRKKVQFFFAGTLSSNRISPFSFPAPVISKVLGADPKLICYQAPIRFKVEKRKIKIDGCAAKRFFIS